MALSACNTVTDLHQKELVEHGSMAFPIACYHDDLPLQTVPWHWHEEWEFAIVSEGCLEFLLENVRVRLNQGEGIFINSLALHAVEPCSSRARLHSAVFHPRLIGGSADSFFHQSLVQPFKDSPLRYVILRPQFTWQAQVLKGLHSAWEAAVEEGDDFENTVRYQLSRSIRLLIRHSSELSAPLSPREQVDAVRIRAMLEYIEDHFQSDLTIKDIARSVAISDSVCLRCFHQMLGTTPMQYVKQLRLAKAAEQLISTSQSVREIALRFGFNDVSYFAKAFREKYRQTPRAYRQARQAEKAPHL